jgi:hypothetical protein
MLAKTTGAQNLSFSGDTPKDLVYQMMKQDFITFTKADYMDEVRDRIKVVYGRKMKFNPGDHQKFVKELLRLELITLEE